MSVEFIGASLVLAASVFGIPVSMAEIITAGIIGFSCASQGVCETARNRHVARIAFFWFVAPILSVGLTYFLVDFYFKFSI
ncbi:inorganic phosphate transporter, partial [bacterium]|nr:inorganic phosphate transporter [bacterium]NIO73018.1 inorganic phosphate transporter [bacterium]